MERVAVIDYGMGNLRSVQKALESVSDQRHDVVVTGDATTIQSADRVVFPGQGALRDAMAELERLALIDVLKAVLGTRPFLGICLGLQALLQYSEEAVETNGLGIYEGNVVRFVSGVDQTGQKLKVPHMGWNTVSQAVDHPLWRGIEDNSYFYFVHSYYVRPLDETRVAAVCDYGVRFACAMYDDQMFAVQFHPEKSQRAGLQLLSNFLDWTP